LIPSRFILYSKVVAAGHKAVWSRTLALAWRREFRTGPGNAFPGNGKQRWAEGRIAELERKIGQQSLEIDFLKGCLQRIEEQRMLQVLRDSAESTVVLSGRQVFDKHAAYSTSPPRATAGC
jgi:hypothetical protein